MAILSHARAASVACVALLVACTGGGGPLGTGIGATSSGGGSKTTSSSGGDPVSQCQDFVTLTTECYQRAGKQLPTGDTSAACSQSLDAQTRAEIDCALASRTAYCDTIVASTSRDAGALLGVASNPEVIKLNACISSHNLASPCKEAVQALANCGAGAGYEPACNEPSRSMAQCVLDNVQGACAFYKPQTTGSIPAEAQKYLDCQLATSRDAGR
jgi:hypothetical protein